MLTQFSITRPTLLIALIMAASGCGSSVPTPEIVPVTGTIKINGEISPRTTIYFRPKGTTKGTGGFGSSGEDGTFKLFHNSGGEGVEPGEYTVAFSKFAMPDGSVPPAGKSPIDTGAKESLPRNLVNPDPISSPYVAVVKADKNEPFNFDLKVKGKK
ncbi:hypothetical protein SH668x_002631 [Planctomicrobium sp. SH668]|uniref:hypothetical protein n=1 Tax=Planctomicrobium sp. SH668 TaxID=3448126 RepID=UPI003F5B7CFE